MSVMPFGKYLESQEMLKRGETPAEGNETSPLELLAMIPPGGAIAVRELGVRARLNPRELGDALERLLKLRLVRLAKVDDEDAVALSDEGAQLKAV
jgi:hypothetical protein